MRHRQLRVSQPDASTPAPTKAEIKASTNEYTFSNKVADTQSQVAVGKTTKVYDQNTKAPVSYAVSLSDNLVAPSNWYVTGNSGQYLVSADSGDLDLSKVKQDVGTYGVSISDSGLAKINAANTNLSTKLTKDNVTSGSLEITKAPFPNNAIVVKGGSKSFDQTATTDPKSYDVTLPDILKPASGWDKNTDGSYKVTVASGDINAQITSQDPGSYTITLSQAAIDKLNAANPNYTLNTKTVTSGSFQIMTDYNVVAGVALSNKGSMPSTILVTVKERAWKTPSNWTVEYDNTGQDSVVYRAPLSDFDTSNVDKDVINSYPVTFSDATLEALHTLNPTVMFNHNNAQDGKVVIRGEVSEQEWSPENYGGTIDGDPSGKIVGGDGKMYKQLTLSEGSSLLMNLSLSNANGGVQLFTNFTEYFIVPAGFKIASTDGSGHAVEASDPAKTVKDSIVATYQGPASSYSNLTVDQITSYKGRQTFRIKFGTVIAGTGLGNAKVPIITDHSSDVTSGWIGAYYASPDDAVLYATDNYADTQGTYHMRVSGYDNIIPVANALGIDNAFTLSSTYNDWFYNYQIIKDIKVKDNYVFIDPSGNTIGNSSSTGNPNDSYTTSSITPETITVGSKTYRLKPSAVDAINTYPLVNKTITPDTKVVDGNTYKIQYQEVVDSSIAANQVKADGQTKSWDGQKPTNYTVTLPTAYKAPESWTKVDGQNGVYKVDASEIDTAEVGSNVGSYPVRLSQKGLSDLAGVNDNYLFTNAIVAQGKATITPKLTVKYVDDQDGGKQVSSTDYTDNLSGNYDIVVPTNYVLAEGQQSPMTYDMTQNNPMLTVHLDHKHNVVENAKTTTDIVHYAGLPTDKQVKDTEIPVTWTSDTDLVTGATSYTSKNEDTVKVPTISGYAPDTASVTFNRISTAAPTDQSKTVTYQAAEAQLTVTYHDDETGQEVPNTSKVLTGVTDGTGIYDVTVPTNYKLAANQNSSVPYKFAAGDDTSDNIMIHLVHDTVSSTFTTNRTITFILKGEGDATKMPGKVTQNPITYNVVTDKVTGLSDATPASQFSKFDSPKVAGYTPDTATVPASELVEKKGLTATQLDALKAPTGIIVQYTADKQTVTVHYVYTNGQEAMKDKTATGVTDTDFSVDTPGLSGYTADKQKVSGKFNADPTKNVYKVVFTANPVIPSNPDKPTAPTTPSTPVTPSTPANGSHGGQTPSTPARLVKKGVVVYGINHIYLYKTPTFSKGGRIAFYAKKPRINRPMFVVIGHETSQQGRMRYKVRDVNHGSDTFGKIGYITTNAKFVIPVYYGVIHKKVTVINPKGVNAYTNRNLTGKVTNYKQGTVLKVYKIVQHNLTTRYYIGNGHYITANKKLVIAGTFKQPKTLKTTRTIYKYSDMNLTHRLNKVKKGTTLKIKKWDYSHENATTKTGSKRYLVAGGHVTGNSRFVKVVK